MIKKKRITLYVSEGNYVVLRIHAVSVNKSVSKFVDEWIQEFLNKNGAPIIKPEKDTIPLKEKLVSLSDLPKIKEMLHKVKTSEFCPHMIMEGGSCNPCGGVAKVI